MVAGLFGVAVNLDFSSHLSSSNSHSMSDEERDIDIESDDEVDGIVSSSGMGLGLGSLGSRQYQTQAEKRAHHNALERKRRDHIKDSFTSLRDSVPALHGEKASRAQILKKAAEYIQFMRRKNTAHQSDIDDLKRQNDILEDQMRALERARANGTYSPMVTSGSCILKPHGDNPVSAFDGGSDSDESDSESQSLPKKVKTESVSA